MSAVKVRPSRVTLSAKLVAVSPAAMVTSCSNVTKPVPANCVMPDAVSTVPAKVVVPAESMVRADPVPVPMAVPSPTAALNAAAAAVSSVRLNGPSTFALTVRVSPAPVVRMITLSFSSVTVSVKVSFPKVTAVPAAKVRPPSTTLLLKAVAVASPSAMVTLSRNIAGPAFAAWLMAESVPSVLWNSMPPAPCMLSNSAVPVPSPMPLTAPLNTAVPAPVMVRLSPSWTVSSKVMVPESVRTLAPMRVTGSLNVCVPPTVVMSAAIVVVPSALVVTVAIEVLVPMAALMLVALAPEELRIRSRLALPSPLIVSSILMPAPPSVRSLFMVVAALRSSTPVEVTVTRPPCTVRVSASAGSSPMLTAPAELSVMLSRMTAPLNVVAVSPAAMVVASSKRIVVPSAVLIPEFVPTVFEKVTAPVTAAGTVKAAPVPLPRSLTTPVMFVVLVPWDAARSRFSSLPSSAAMVSVAPFPPVVSVVAAFSTTPPRFSVSPLSPWIVPPRLSVTSASLASTPPSNVVTSPDSLPSVTIPWLFRVTALANVVVAPVNDRL